MCLEVGGSPWAGLDRRGFPKGMRSQAWPWEIVRSECCGQEGKADSKKVIKKKDLMSVLKVELCVTETEREAHLAYWSRRPFGENEVYPSTQRISKFWGM